VHTSLDIGGAQSVRYLFLKYLNSKNINIRVCCLGEKGFYGSRIEKLGYKVDAFNRKYGFFNIVTTFKLYKYIKSGKFDVVQSSLFFANYHAAIAVLMAKVPVLIIEEHGEHNFHLKARHIFHRIAGYFISMVSQAIICCSESMKLEVSKVYKVPMHKIYVFKNMVDDKKIEISCSREEMRNKLKVPLDAMVIGTIGSLSWIKNQKFLINCFTKINKDNKFLILIGDGPLKQELKDYADRLKISGKLCFTGWREDISDILNAIDIFVLPSLSEGIPMSLLEAMSMGLPCIATCVGGVPEIIKDDTVGITVRSNDLKMLENAMNNSSTNLEKAKEIGAMAREYVLKNFSIDSYINNVLGLYKNK